jgi:hypothetical protein
MTNQWMKNPCSHKWYATTSVTIHAMWIFLILVVFSHLSKAIIEFVVACVNYDLFFLFATKIVIVYFQISSNDR